jgi:hypothetical protein
MIRHVNADELDDLPPEDARPWMDAVDPALVSRTSSKRRTTIWWADNSPLIRELYDAIDERESDDD